MSMIRREPPPLPAATFHILIALAEEERHGYAIMRDVAQRTNGQFRIGPATLYTSIRRMTDAGLIEEAGERDDSAAESRRRYYRLTKAGRAAAIAEANRLESMLTQAHARFSHLRTRTGRRWA
jgi:DNA-binding PadR family transcriptional regulator